MNDTWKRTAASIYPLPRGVHRGTFGIKSPWLGLFESAFNP